MKKNIFILFFILCLFSCTSGEVKKIRVLPAGVEHIGILDPIKIINNINYNMEKQDEFARNIYYFIENEILKEKNPKNLDAVLLLLKKYSIEMYNMISIDRLYWGEAELYTDVDSIYIKCGYNSEDVDILRPSNAIKVNFDKNKKRLFIEAGKNSKEKQWDKYIY